MSMSKSKSKNMLDSFLNDTFRVDQQRIYGAKRHIQNGDSFQTCIREDINNATAYGANELLYCNHLDPIDGKDYLICGHNGDGFDDAVDIAKALMFNMGKGLGTQNSGIPASALLMNINTSNIAYGIFSKTKDGNIIRIPNKGTLINEHKRSDLLFKINIIIDYELLH